MPSSSFDSVAIIYGAVYVACINKRNEVALLRRSTSYMNGKWGLPAGKLDTNETVLQAAVREAEEEAGADIQITDLVHLISVHRTSASDSMQWCDYYFVCRGRDFN